MTPNLLWGNEQTNEKHNTYAYCISFFLSLFKIQNDVYGSLVGSTKKKNKKEGKGINGMHGKKRRD
jgi:hypothetical protein